MEDKQVEAKPIHIVILCVRTLRIIPISTFPWQTQTFTFPLLSFNPLDLTCKLQAMKWNSRKFLRNRIAQTLPDWRDKFLSYQVLKKHLKPMCPKDPRNPPRLDTDVTKEINDFLQLLEVEILKFDAFFLENTGNNMG